MSLGIRAGISAVMAFTAVITLGATCFAAPAKKGAVLDELKSYVENLKKSPDDKALREKIIRMALGMRRLSLPEEAQRHMARGTAFAERASDTAGYKRAIVEFEAASNAAPWLGLAYFNLGVMQEKAGLFTAAIQSLKWYLLATPHAKNARDVKNKIYALEADAEAVEAGMNAPAEASQEPGENGKLRLAGKNELEIEPEKQFKVIKLSVDKRDKMPNFAGNWYFKEKIRGEDVTIHAFEIQKSSNGDLKLIPPKRAADSYAAINIFEIAEKNMKLQMKWKMRSVVGYWKTETYVLTISDDGSKLKGSHNQKSVGGRNIDMDRVLFRQ